MTFASRGKTQSVRGPKTPIWLGYLILISSFSSLFPQPTDPPDESLNFRFENLSLRQAIDALVKKYDLAIVYQMKHFPKNAVTLTCNPCSREEALRKILLGSGLGWKKVGSQYILIRSREHSGTIRGVISVKNTGQPLSGVEIQLKSVRDNAVHSGFTDKDGRFTLDPIPAGTYHLEARAYGFANYESRNLVVDAKGTTERQIQMEITPVPLQEMVVMPSYFALAMAEPETKQVFNREEILRITHLGDDIYRVADHLPGISTADISSDFRVRGGDGKDILVLLDGTELYDPYHLKALGYGLTSIVDSEVVGQMELLTGTFPSQYGDKMSAVFNLASAVPASEQRTTLGMNFLGLRLKTEDSFHSGRGGYLVSVRRGFTDLAFELTNDDPNEKVDGTYDDVFAKLEYRLSPTQTMAAYILYAINDFKDIDPSDDGPPEHVEILDNQSNSLYLWSRLKSTWNANLWSETRLAFNFNDSELVGSDNFGPRQYELNDKRGFDFASIHQDWHYTAGDRHYFKGGFFYERAEGFYDYHNQKTDHGTFLGTNVGETAHQLDLTTREYGLYLADRIQVTPNLTSEIGLRFDAQSHTSESQLSPRFSMVYAIDHNNFLKLGWGYFHQSQAIHQLQVQDATAAFSPAELAEHVGFSFDHRFFDGTEFRVEMYYKEFKNPRPRFENYLDPLASLGELLADRILIAPREARAKGIEFLVKKRRSEGLSWMFNYTYSESSDRLENGWIPKQWDQPNSLNINLNYNYKSLWNFNSSFHWHNGWLVTDVFLNSVFNGEGFDHSPVVGPLFGRRLPDYRRIDVRASRELKLRNNQKLTFFLEVTNLLDTDNIKAFDDPTIFFDNEGDPLLSYNEEDWIPRLPSLGLTWVF